MNDEKAKFKEEFVKRLVTFTLDVMRFAAEIRADRNLQPLADQVIRSAGSVGANVVEAKGSSTTKDYTRYFTIALKSANETKYWLLVAQKYCDSASGDVATKLLAEATELANILGTSIVTLKRAQKE